MAGDQFKQLESEKNSETLIAQDFDIDFKSQGKWADSPSPNQLPRNEKQQIMIDQLTNVDCAWYTSSDITVNFPTPQGGNFPATIHLDIPKIVDPGNEIVANVIRSDDPNAPPDHFEGKILADGQGTLWFDGIVTHGFTRSELQSKTNEMVLRSGYEMGKSLSTRVQFPLNQLRNDNPWKDQETGD